MVGPKSQLSSKISLVHQFCCPHLKTIGALDIGDYDSNAGATFVELDIYYNTDAYAEPEDLEIIFSAKNKVWLFLHYGCTGKWC